MRVAWSGTLRVAATPQELFTYLADVPRHGDWATTLERITRIRAGHDDAGGVGARYRTSERVALGGREWMIATICEVRELVPGECIAWTAHPVPRVGWATLRFTFTPTPDGSDAGGTLLTQTVTEVYPPPISWLLRLTMNLTPATVERQLAQSLARLGATLATRPWEWERDPGATAQQR